MSDRAIRYIEAGEREPSVDAIQKIAAALGCHDRLTLWMMPPSRRNSAMTNSTLTSLEVLPAVAQAKKIKEQTSALLQAASVKIRLILLKEMETHSSCRRKRRGKKFTPKNICIDLQGKRSRCWTTLLLLRRRCSRRYKAMTQKLSSPSAPLKLKTSGSAKRLMGFYTVLNCEYIGIIQTASNNADPHWLTNLGTPFSTGNMRHPVRLSRYIFL